MGIYGKVKGQSLSVRAVFLDRDGVLNCAIIRDGKPYPPSKRSEVEILPGVADALIDLKNAGYLLIVVSNQPDVARKSLSRIEVESINELLSEKLIIDEFIMCYHDNCDNCDCRKPKPGMILSATRKYDIDLTNSYMVGDRWRDIAAGQAAGCRTIFIDCHYKEVYPRGFDYITDSLSNAAAIILRSSNS